MSSENNRSPCVRAAHPLSITVFSRPFVLHKFENPAANLDRLIPRLPKGARHGGTSHGLGDNATLAQFPNLEIVASFGVGYTTSTRLMRPNTIQVIQYPHGPSPKGRRYRAWLWISRTLRRIRTSRRYLRFRLWTTPSFPLEASARCATVSGHGRMAGSPRSGAGWKSCRSR